MYSRNETVDQRNVIISLDELREQIQNTEDRQKITAYVNKAVSLANPVEPRYVEWLSNESINENKRRILQSLTTEIATEVNNQFKSIEDVHFQISASIVRLMMVFTDGLDGVDYIVSTKEKKHVI
jgi:hypothetical protein